MHAVNGIQLSCGQLSSRQLSDVNVHGCGHCGQVYFGFIWNRQRQRRQFNRSYT